MKTVDIRHSRLITAGLLLGIGLGGFADGILFHQILQTHSMLSARVPTHHIDGMKINMVWDGLFHALMWIVTMLGIWALWKAGRSPGESWPGRVLAGGWLSGWGLFNVVEGLTNHYVLGLHHVVERMGLSPFDHLFLVFGVVLGVSGWLLIRSVRRERATA